MKFKSGIYHLLCKLFNLHIIKSCCLCKFNRHCEKWNTILLYNMYITQNHIFVVDTCPGKIHRNRDQLFPWPHKCFLNLTYYIKHIFIQAYNQSILLIKWNKFTWRYHRAIFFLPSYKCFRTCDFFCYYIIFRLEINHKFFIADSFIKLIFHHPVTDMFPPHLLIIKSKRMLIVILYTLHGKKCPVTDQSQR